jgi:hypothetical protein
LDLGLQTRRPREILGAVRVAAHRGSFTAKRRTQESHDAG